MWAALQSFKIYRTSDIHSLREYFLKNLGVSHSVLGGGEGGGGSIKDGRERAPTRGPDGPGPSELWLCSIHVGKPLKFSEPQEMGVLNPKTRDEY